MVVAVTTSETETHVTNKYRLPFYR